jgi:hypothetical protein
LGRIEALDQPKCLGYNSQKKQEDFCDGTKKNRSLMLQHSEEKKGFKGSDMVPSPCEDGMNYKSQSN